MRHARNFIALFTTLILVMGMSGYLWAGDMEAVNINTASEKELMQFEGIGKSKAVAIVKYRKEKGPFKKPGDIINVPGIGPKFFEQNKARITVGEAAKAVTPVKEVADKATQPVKEAADKAAQPVKEAADKAAQPVKEAAEKAVQPVKEAADKAAQPVKEAAEKADKPVKTVAGKVNINTASEKDLMQLHGIGKAKAVAIVKYREDKGSFKKPEDIKNVSGIGPKLFEQNRTLISVGEAAKSAEKNAEKKEAGKKEEPSGGKGWSR